MSQKKKVLHSSELYPRKFEKITEGLYRLKIYGGWIVKSNSHSFLIEDKEHLWVLSPPEE